MEQQNNASSKMMWILFSVLGVSVLVVMVGILFLSVSGKGAVKDSVSGSPTTQDDLLKDNSKDNDLADNTTKKGDSSSKSQEITSTDFSFDEWVRGSQDFPGLEKSEKKLNTKNTNVIIDGDKATVQWSPKTKKTKLVDEKNQEEIPLKKSEPKIVEKKIQENGLDSVEDKMLNESAKKIKTTVYWIQVASFTDSYKAEVLRNDFLEKGISSVISTTEVNGETWFRVRVGAFNSKEEAGYYQDQISGMADIDKTYIVEGTVMKTMIN